MSLSQDSNTLKFKPLSEAVQIYRPQDITAYDPESPRLILVFGFNNAPMRTMLRDYLNNHVKKWPSASIILFSCTSTWLVRSEKDKERLLTPAVKVLDEEVYGAPGNATVGTPSGILAHVLSNGGGLVFTTLMKLLERTLSSRQGGVPPSLSLKRTSIPLAIVFDSVPSGGIDGGPLVAPIKSPVARAAALVPANLACHVLFASYFLLGVPQPFRVMQAHFLREDIVPGVSDYSTPRLYFYSEGDEFVSYKDIEEHLHYLREAIVSKQAIPMEGQWPVFVEKYKPSSKHVMHVRTDPARYWKAIDGVWKVALGRPSRRAKL